MIDLEINIDLNELSHIEGIADALEDTETLHMVAAQGGGEEQKSHLRDKYVPRNKRGNFWERVHDSVEISADEDSGTIAMTELGIRLRYHGGEVRPGVNKAAAGPNKGNTTKALAVPSDAVPVSNGRQLSPAFMGPLAFLFGKRGSESVGYLVEGEEKTITRGKNKGKKRIVPKKGGDLMYTLRSITRHKADTGIIPEDEISSAAVAALSDHLDSFL